MIKFSKHAQTISVFFLGLVSGLSYLTSCGQTNSANSNPTDGTLITAESLVTTGVITAGGNITAPSITLTNGAAEGKFLKSSASGEATWSSPFRTSCPTGYTLIGTSGSDDAFCITTGPENIGTRTWDQAYNHCSLKTPSASLCTINEWRKACKTSTELTQKDAGIMLLDFVMHPDGGAGMWVDETGNCEPGELYPRIAFSFRCCFK
jgi:hypothetical protein